MKRYIGLKIIQGEPQGKDAGKDIAQDGYNVIYEDGYESWSPSAAFDKAYREIGAGLPFSIVLECMKRDGESAWRREGWNASGMWIKLQRPDEHSKMDLPYFYIYTSSFQLVPWVPSVTDLIADDWFEVS